MRQAEEPSAFPAMAPLCGSNCEPHCENAKVLEEAFSDKSKVLIDGWGRRSMERLGAAHVDLRTATASLFKPVIQVSVRALSKLSLEAAISAQARKASGARARNDEPGRLDLAGLDALRTLKHKRSFLAIQASGKPLHAHHRGRSIAMPDLQRPDGRGAIDIPREGLRKTDLYERWTAAYVVGVGLGALDVDLRESVSELMRGHSISFHDARKAGPSVVASTFDARPSSARAGSERIQPDAS